jgi:N-acetylmuramoyl-L-alanine amidase
MVTCRLGDTGAVVAEVRSKLARLELGAPGDTFDPPTDRAVRAFQQQRGLRVDGVVGSLTYRALDEAHWRLGDRLLTEVIGHPFVGDDVVALQHRLHDLGFDPGRIDGIFGASTSAALREFQRGVGLPTDGAAGPGTLAALQRLSRTVTGGSPTARREEERLRSAGPSLRGRVVMVDPGHGGSDPGATGHGLTEAEVALDLARRVEGRLGVLGVRTYLTHGGDGVSDDASRARIANDVGADLLISLHVDTAATPVAGGVATAYYGAQVRGRLISSTLGERLAWLVQSEIVARTDLVDCRCHAKAWELLRLTRMPAVRVDVGYLSHPQDAARLRSPAFRDTVAEALSAAVQRLYLPDLDVPTGQLFVGAAAG